MSKGPRRSFLLPKSSPGSFRRLLDVKKRAKGIATDKDLCERLKPGPYPMPASTLATYLTGARSMPIEVVLHISNCLDLSDQERETLFAAAFADTMQEIDAAIKQVLGDHENA